MAALYGRIRGYNSRGPMQRKAHTVTGSEEIVAQLETWEHSIRVQLNRDGGYEVLIGEKHTPRRILAQGNLADSEGA